MLNLLVDRYSANDPRFISIHTIRSYILTYKSGPNKFPIQFKIDIKEYLGSNASKSFEASTSYNKINEDYRQILIYGNGDSLESALSSLLENVRLGLGFNEIYTSSDIE